MAGKGEDVEPAGGPKCDREPRRSSIHSHKLGVENDQFSRLKSQKKLRTFPNSTRKTRGISG